MAQPATVLLLTLPLCWLLWREWLRLKVACAPKAKRHPQPARARAAVQLAR